MEALSAIFGDDFVVESEAARKYVINVDKEIRLLVSRVAIYLFFTLGVHKFSIACNCMHREIHNNKNPNYHGTMETVNYRFYSK